MKTQETSLTPEQCREARRNRLGLTQQQLAKGAGVSRTLITGFETGGLALSEPVKLKLLDYLAAEMEKQGLDPEDVFGSAGDTEAGGIDGSADASSTRAPELRRAAVGNGTGRRSKFIKGAECIYISGAVADEAERERMHERMETIRDRLAEIGEQEAKPGIFDPFDDDTDKLIDEGRALITETGLLYLRLFGHDLAPAPTPAMVQRKQRPATVADALGLVFADVFKALRVRRNGKRTDPGEDQDEEQGAQRNPKDPGKTALAA